MGAGFYIKNNLVATARHVVDGCTRATVENNDGKTSEGTVIIKETDLDIAFISTEATIASIVTIDKGPRTRGEAISIVGAPIDGLVLSSGRLKNYDANSNEFRITLDIPADHGNSGGPVFSEKGLIGLIVAKSDFGSIYAYDQEQIDEALAAKSNSRTEDVQMMISNNSELENLLLASSLFNGAFLIVIAVLFAKRKRYNKNQVVINL